MIEPEPIPEGPEADEAIRRLLERRSRSRERKCRRCGIGRRWSDWQYCKGCGTKLLWEMWNAGYLVRLPGRRRWRDGEAREAREAILETRRGRDI
jgi:hypothetical protein